MSRPYEIKVTVGKMNIDKQKGILDMLLDRDRFEEGHESNWNNMPEIFAEGSFNLFAGETEEEYADEIIFAIWKENGAWCEVNVGLIDLSNVPFEDYSHTREVYDKMKKNEKI